jgi:hypothetical protein
MSELYLERLQRVYWLPIRFKLRKARAPENLLLVARATAGYVFHWISRERSSVEVVKLLQEQAMLGVELLLASVAVVSATSVTLPPSSPGTLHVLYTDGWPVARSYDGHGWERTQGGATLDLACNTGVACVVTVPASTVYNITLHAAPAVDALQKASRFLVQTTFGPTRATVQSVDATTGSLMVASGPLLTPYSSSPRSLLTYRRGHYQVDR